MISPAIFVTLWLAACAHHSSQDIQPPPEWASKQGKDHARIELAEVMLSGGSPAAALKLIAQMRAEGVQDPELEVLHGRALREVGMVDDARDVLQEVVARHPRDAAAHEQLGILAMDQQQLDEATEHFEKARHSKPDDAAIANNLGFAYLSAGRTDEAVETLRAALRLDSTQARTRNNLGFALVASGREQEAYRLFLAGDTAAAAHYNVGLGLELRGDPTQARQQYTLSLRDDPDFGPAREALDRLEPTEPPR